MENISHDRPFSDSVISDFTDPVFQKAFKRYFADLGCSIRDWDGLFREMNSEGDNAALVRTGADGEIVGFILCKPVKFSSFFFEETCGFIREFWVSSEYRNRGHGSALLSLAEKRFLEDGIYTSILTTDSAPNFYEKRGYVRAPGCQAKNHDEVFVKRLQ